MYNIVRKQVFTELCAYIHMLCAYVERFQFAHLIQRLHNGRVYVYCLNVIISMTKWFLYSADQKHSIVTHLIIHNMYKWYNNTSLGVYSVCRCMYIGHANCIDDLRDFPI